MSGFSYGKTAEQAALDFLTVIADPALHRDRLIELKNTLATVSAEQAKLESQRAEVTATEANAKEHSDTAAKALDEARQVNADTEDRRAEIAHRQGAWEANLNARESELKKAQEAHTKALAQLHIQAEAAQKSLDAREGEIVGREQAADRRAAILDQRQAELDKQAQAAEELARLLRR